MTSVVNEQRNANSNRNEVWSLLIKKVNCVWVRMYVCATAERNVIILKMGLKSHKWESHLCWKNKSLWQEGTPRTRPEGPGARRKWIAPRTECSGKGLVFRLPPAHVRGWGWERFWREWDIKDWRMRVTGRGKGRNLASVGTDYEIRWQRCGVFCRSLSYQLSCARLLSKHLLRPTVSCRRWRGVGWCFEELKEKTLFFHLDWDRTREGSNPQEVRGNW